MKYLRNLNENYWQIAIFRFNLLAFISIFFLIFLLATENLSLRYVSILWQRESTSHTKINILKPRLNASENVSFAFFYSELRRKSLFIFLSLSFSRSSSLSFLSLFLSFFLSRFISKPSLSNRDNCLLFNSASYNFCKIYVRCVKSYP